MPTIVWIQVDSQGTISFENVEPSEEDLNLFRADSSPEKYLFWAEFSDRGALIRVLDADTGVDKTPVPWIRNLALSKAPTTSMLS